MIIGNDAPEAPDVGDLSIRIKGKVYTTLYEEKGVYCVQVDVNKKRIVFKCPSRKHALELGKMLVNCLEGR